MQDTETPIIEQTVFLMKSLPLDKQKTVVDFINFLASKGDSSPHFKSQKDAIKTSDLSNSKPASSLEDLFGMVKTDRNVSLEEMDTVIRFG